jgi:ketosteroid isomerase-like protein
MYKATMRWLIRRNVRRLNEGDLGPTLAMYADDATLTFPGDNSWARQFRAPGAGREPHPTHRGRAEIEEFLRRFVAEGIQMEVEDVLVNGPPWNARAAIVVHDWVPGPDGADVYANRAVLLVHSRWGRIDTHEDFEDTERVRAFDDHLARMTVA